MKPQTKFLILSLFLLFFISLSTQYFGSTDISDYVTPAKYFAGEYQAKLRVSRSYFYGFLSAPFIKLADFTGMKIASLIWLSLIILSLYFLTNKNKRVLYLLITSPVVWYIAPWINPIQATTLFFLWGYFFLQKYEQDEDKKIKNLIFSGLFIGFAGAFWNTTLYFTVLLMLPFFYNKKISTTFIFLMAVLIGLLPRLILDAFLFNFPFYTIMRGFFGTITNVFLGGIRGQHQTSSLPLLKWFLVLAVLPIYFFILYPKIFKQHKKPMIFITLCLLLILANPQIRYTLFLVPFIILYLYPFLNKKQFKKQIIISLIICLIVLFPYVLQTKYNISGKEISSFISVFPALYISSQNPIEIMRQDLNNISRDFPNQIFVVGNEPDTYQELALIYKQDKIKEFISIEDYKMFFENNSTLFSKSIYFKTNAPIRREIWLSGGLNKNSQDQTDYESITYAISDQETLDLDNFKLIKKYQILSVFKKSNQENL